MTGIRLGPYSCLHTNLFNFFHFSWNFLLFPLTTDKETSIISATTFPFTFSTPSLSRPAKLDQLVSLINSYKLLNRTFSSSTLFRFKLTTTKFAVIVKRAAQGSIYRVYVCHQTRQLSQFPQWDSTLNRERRRHGFATATVSSWIHRETVFRLVQLVATHHRAVTIWTSTRRFQWPLQVSVVPTTEKVFGAIISLESSDFAWINTKANTRLGFNHMSN